MWNRTTLGDWKRGRLKRSAESLLGEEHGAKAGGFSSGARTSAGASGPQGPGEARSSAQPRTLLSGASLHNLPVSSGGFPLHFLTGCVSLLGQSVADWGTQTTDINFHTVLEAGSLR